MFQSLSTRPYRLWFFGALVSNIGAWMQSTTQDWVVLTKLTDNDAAAVGVTMALQFGPQLLLVPVTGLIIDRFQRRHILLVTQTCLMLLAAGLGILLLSGHAELWHLYCFALALGIVNAFDAPARQTFVSELVDDRNMANAVALNSTSFNSARLIGPSVAGLLIVAVGSGWVFLLNAVSFIAMIGVLVALGREKLRTVTRAPRRPGDVFAGFVYVAQRRDLLLVFIIVFIIGAFGMNFPIFSSTMAVLFGRDAGGYGLLSSIIAIGSLVGSLLAARRAKPTVRLVVVIAGVFGAAALLSSVMPTYTLFALSLVLLGFSTVTMLTTANSYVQTTTEPAVRGRVMAVYTAILMGSTLIGAPVVGAVASDAGARWGLRVGALSGVVACVIGLVWRHRTRHLEALHAAAATSSTDTSVPTGSTHGDIGPEHFSEQVALTSPIPLPTTAARREQEAARARLERERAAERERAVSDPVR
jgi:MFS family permease